MTDNGGIMSGFKVLQNMKYIIIFSLYLTACDVTTIPGNPNVLDTSDVIETDTRDCCDVILINRDSSEKDSFYIKDPEIVINTDFPAPNWFR